jgi:hypothetical protein
MWPFRRKPKQLEAVERSGYVAQNVIERKQLDRLATVVGRQEVEISQKEENQYFKKNDENIWVSWEYALARERILSGKISPFEARALLNFPNASMTPWVVEHPELFCAWCGLKCDSIDERDEHEDVCGL